MTDDTNMTAGLTETEHTAPQLVLFADEDTNGQRLADRLAAWANDLAIRRAVVGGYTMWQEFNPVTGQSVWFARGQGVEPCPHCQAKIAGADPSEGGLGELPEWMQRLLRGGKTDESDGGDD